MTKRWITKYWQTEGVVEKRGEYSASDRRYFYVGRIAHSPIQICPGDHFATREEAVVRAEELRKKKIASLKRQIAKLEAMTF